MIVLITGGSGFVGVETTGYFNANGLKTANFDLMNGGDIRDKKQFEQVVLKVKPDRILHLAAVARFEEADKNIERAHSINVLGTKNVAEIAAKHHIPIVYSSTGSVYMPIKEEPPITENFAVAGNSVYGCTKALGEKYIQKPKNTWIILRYAHLYGKEKRYHGLIGGFLSRIERGLAPKLYGGKQSNDFTYIKDVVRANYLAVTAAPDKWNQAYNIGTGEELTAEEAGDMICKVANYKGEIEKVPQREVDPGRFVYDITKTESMLGFRAEFDFLSGLKDMFTT